MASQSLQSYREKMDRIEKQLEQLKETYTRDIVIRNTSDKKLNVSLTMEDPGIGGESFQSRIQVPEFTQYTHRIVTEIDTLEGKEIQKGFGQSGVILERGSAQRYKEKAFSAKEEEKSKEVVGKQEFSTPKMEEKISGFEEKLRNLPNRQLFPTNTTAIEHKPHISSDLNQQPVIKISESSLILSDLPSEGDIQVNSPEKNRQTNNNRFKLTESIQIEPASEDFRPYSLAKQDSTHRKIKQTIVHQPALNYESELNYRHRNQDMSRGRSQSDKQFKQRHLNVGASAQKREIEKMKTEGRSKLNAETERSRGRSITAFSPLRKTFEDCRPKGKITMSPDIKINTPVQPKRADQLYLERHNSFLYSKGTPKPKDCIFPRDRSPSEHLQSSSKKPTSDKFKISPKAQEVTDRLHSRSNKKLACDHQTKFSTRNSREKFDQLIRDNSFALRNLNKREREILYNNLKEKGDSMEAWPKHIVNFAYYKFKQSRESQTYINI